VRTVGLKKDGSRRGSIFGAQAPSHAPIVQDGSDLFGHEMAGALLVVVLLQQLVVVSEYVPHIGNEGEPGGALRGGDSQPRAVDSVVNHGAELVCGDPGGQATQCHLDVTALSHID
jgi:hypothetical protein